MRYYKRYKTGPVRLDARTRGQCRGTVGSENGEQGLQPDKSDFDARPPADWPDDVPGGKSFEKDRGERSEVLKN